MRLWEFLVVLCYQFGDSPSIQEYTVRQRHLDSGGLPNIFEKAVSQLSMLDRQEMGLLPQIATYTVEAQPT